MLAITYTNIHKNLPALANTAAFKFVNYRFYQITGSPNHAGFAITVFAESLLSSFRLKFGACINRELWVDYNGFIGDRGIRQNWNWQIRIRQKQDSVNLNSAKWNAAKKNLQNQLDETEDSQTRIGTPGIAETRFCEKQQVTSLHRRRFVRYWWSDRLLAFCKIGAF